MPLLWQQSPAKLVSADVKAVKLTWLWSRISFCSIHLSPIAGPEEAVFIAAVVRVQFGIQALPL